MNSQKSEGEEAAADPQEDSLTRSSNDAAQNFWFNDVGCSTAACDSSSAPTVVSPDKKHWIEIVLLDKQGNPVPGENYAIKLPNGSTVAGSLNTKGRARVEGIDAGTCKVTFPDLDQHSWKPR